MEKNKKWEKEAEECWQVMEKEARKDLERCEDAVERLNKELVLKHSELQNLKFQVKQIDRAYEELYLLGKKLKVEI